MFFFLFTAVGELCRPIVGISESERTGERSSWKDTQAVLADSEVRATLCLYFACGTTVLLLP